MTVSNGKTGSMKDTETVTPLRKILKSATFCHEPACECQLNIPKAEAAIIKLFEVVIGNNERDNPANERDFNNYAAAKIRNNLKAKQRQRLQALSNSGKTGE